MDNASLGNRFYVKLLFYRLVEPYVGIILDYTTELYQYSKTWIPKSFSYISFNFTNHLSFDKKLICQNYPKLYYLYLELLLSHVSLYSVYYLLPFQNHIHRSITIDPRVSSSLLFFSRILNIIVLPIQSTSFDRERKSSSSRHDSHDVI